MHVICCCYLLRQMAEKSFEWAKSRGLHRNNEVHGEEEARLVLEDSFALSTQDGWEGEMSGSIELGDSQRNITSHGL